MHFMQVAAGVALVAAAASYTSATPSPHSMYISATASAKPSYPSSRLSEEVQDVLFRAIKDVNLKYDISTYDECKPNLKLKDQLGHKIENAIIKAQTIKNLGATPSRAELGRIVESIAKAGGYPTMTGAFPVWTPSAACAPKATIIKRPRRHPKPSTITFSYSGSPGKALQYLDEVKSSIVADSRPSPTKAADVGRSGRRTKRFYDTSAQGEQQDTPVHDDQKPQQGYHDEQRRQQQEPGGPALRPFNPMERGHGPVVRNKLHPHGRSMMSPDTIAAHPGATKAAHIDRSGRRTKRAWDAACILLGSNCG